MVFAIEPQVRIPVRSLKNVRSMAGNVNILAQAPKFHKKALVCHTTSFVLNPFIIKLLISMVKKIQGFLWLDPDLLVKMVSFNQIQELNLYCCGEVMNVTILKKFNLLAVLAGLLAFNGLAYAEVCDLTTLSSTCTEDGAIFIQIDTQSTGTGVISSFVEVGDATPNGDQVHGYNTTENGTLDNGSSPTFNHELLLSDVPIVDINGTLYREFILDINELNSGTESLLSLDEIQIFQSGDPNQGSEAFSGGVLVLTDSYLVWRLDGPGTGADDDVIKLEYDLNTGSGSGDMFLYVPNSLFSDDDQYVYLYSAFGGLGGDFTNTDGFEEWAVREATTPVPEPATLVLLGTGLLGVASKVRRRMKKS